MEKETGLRSDEHQKKSHDHVTADTPGQAKTKTNPLQGNASKASDADEGDMNNGEVGNDLQNDDQQ